MVKHTVAMVLVLAGVLAPATTWAQEIFSDDFENAGICFWSNADQTDGDSDGYKLCHFDCDDGNPSINPGKTDTCGDGVDNDCTGFADESCCHPLLQNCQDGAEACFYNFIHHTFLCGTPFGNPPGQQDDPCDFVNACDEGFGCTLCLPMNCDAENLLCAAYCDPDLNDCATGETCLLYDEFWGDVAPAPNDFGMCVPNESIPQNEAPAGLRWEPQCYDLGVSFALLYIVLGIIAFYLVAGVLRYIRQEMQPPPNEKRKRK